MATRVEMRLGIDQVSFDVPKTVVAFVAMALDGAGVQQFAGNGMR
jgi:hypothetical protein